ncbi:Glucose-repressible protein [Fusarium oxysporum f. sp. albedinis]|nr:Glucose-repressible protein [Fusarium oxysporum f. sp. albedinis]
MAEGYAEGRPVATNKFQGPPLNCTSHPPDRFRHDDDDDDRSIILHAMLHHISNFSKFRIAIQIIFVFVSNHSCPPHIMRSPQIY